MFWFYPIIAVASAVVAGGIAVIIIDHVITHGDIKRKIVSLTIKKAFKYKILKAKKHSVNVGIFDKKDNFLDSVELKSDAGMSKSVTNSVSNEYYL